MGITLQVDGVFLDTFNNKKIGLTKTSSNVGSVEVRSGGFSNQLTLPKTNKNIKVLRVKVDGKSEASPFFDVELLTDSTRFQRGRLSIESVDKQGINVRVFFDTSNFLADIKEITFFDVFSDGVLFSYDADFNQKFATPVDWREEWVFFPYESGYTLNTQTTFTRIDFEFKRLRPAVFVRAILERLAFQNRYILKGNLLESNAFNNLVVPTFGEQLIDPNYTIDDQTTVVVGQEFTLNQLGGGYAFLDSSTIFINPPNDPQLKHWNDAGDYPDQFQQFTPLNIAYGFTIQVTGSIRCTINPVNQGNVSLRIAIFNSDSSIILSDPITWDFSESGEQRTINNETVIPDFWAQGINSVPLKIGFIVSDGNSLNLPPTVQFDANYIVKDFTFNAVTLPPDSIPNNPLAPQVRLKLGSEVKVIDIISSALKAFRGLIYTDSNTRTVYIDRFEDVCRQTQLDWTGKVDTLEPFKLDFQDDLNKVNIITWEQAEDEISIRYEGVNQKQLGEGSYQLDRLNVSTEKQTLEVKVAPPIKVGWQGGNTGAFLPYLPCFPTDVEVSESYLVNFRNSGGLVQYVINAERDELPESLRVAGSLVQVTDSELYAGIHRIQSVSGSGSPTTVVLDLPFIANENDSIVTGLGLNDSFEDIGTYFLVYQHKNVGTFSHDTISIDFNDNIKQFQTSDSINYLQSFAVDATEIGLVDATRDMPVSLDFQRVNLVGRRTDIPTLFEAFWFTWVRTEFIETRAEIFIRLNVNDWSTFIFRRPIHFKNPSIEGTWVVTEIVEFNTQKKSTLVRLTRIS